MQMYVKLLTLDIKKNNNKIMHMPMCRGAKELEFWLQLSEKLPDSIGALMCLFF